MDYLQIVEKIRETWETKYGLALSIILLFVGVYFLIDGIEYLKHLSAICKGSTYILLGLVVWIYWVFDTNRFFLRGNKEFVVALVAEVDDDIASKRVKKVLKSVKRDISEITGLEAISIRILPLNYKQRTTEFLKLLENQRHAQDGIISVKIDSGKKNGEEQLLIKDIQFIGFFNPERPKKNIFFKSIDVSKDLALGSYHKDWKYLYSNDLIDKEKVKNGLIETTLIYSGIYLIYQEKYQLALDVLGSIFKIENARIKGKEIEPGKHEYNLSPDNIIAGRLTTIILDLYFRLAFDKFNEKKLEEALKLCEQCEKLFPNSPYSYRNYIHMARFSFELGILDDAKKYTLKAEEYNPNHIYVHVNKGWFAAIENDQLGVANAYEKIFHTGFTQDINAVDLLVFFERYKKDYPKSKTIFNFLEAFTTKISVNQIDGDKMLEAVLEDLKAESMNDLFLLARRTKNLGAAGIAKRNKAITAQRTQKSNSRNKKKRKKRR